MSKKSSVFMFFRNLTVDGYNTPFFKWPFHSRHTWTRWPLSRGDEKDLLAPEKGSGDVRLNSTTFREWRKISYVRQFVYTALNLHFPVALRRGPFATLSPHPLCPFFVMIGGFLEDAALSLNAWKFPHSRRFSRGILNFFLRVATMGGYHKIASQLEEFLKRALYGSSPLPRLSVAKTVSE